MSNKVDKRPRRAEEAWCVGRKPVLDLIQNKPERIVTLYLLDQSKNLDDQAFSGLSPSIIKKISPDKFFDQFKELIGLNHQGYLAKINPSSPVSLDQLIQKSQKNGSGIIIGLDQVQDPHNLGAIFRSAEALGADGIFFSSNKSANITAVVRRVSVGATEFMPYAEVSNIASALRKLKDKGYWIFGTSLATKSEELSKTEMLFPLVLMFGSEGEGLRHLTETLCDKLVRIEQYGMTESLNVSSAVGILLYNARLRVGKV